MGEQGGWLGAQQWSLACRTLFFGLCATDRVIKKAVLLTGSLA